MAKRSKVIVDPDAARREIEATHFAMELLMPEQWLRADLEGKVVDLENDEMIKRLAKRYKVSEQLMTIRIAQLFGS